MSNNKCPQCGFDSYKLARGKHHDIFSCYGCLVKFEDTGTGPELIRGEFEQDMIYSGAYWSAGIKLPVCILIKGRFNNFGPTVHANIVGCGFELDANEPYVTFKVRKFERAEYVQIGNIKIWAHNSSN